MDASRPPAGFMKNLRVMFDVRDVMTDVNAVVTDTVQQTTDNITGAGPRCGGGSCRAGAGQACCSRRGGVEPPCRRS